MLYTLARGFIKYTKPIWSLLIITTIVGVIANLLVADVRNLSYTVLVIVFQWLLVFGFYQKIVLSIFALFIILTIVALFVRGVEEYKEGGRALRKYLRIIIDNYRNLKPVGFAQDSALISVSVPLDEIFIHLQTVSDRPRYDIPAEQRRMLEELRQRPDLSPQERERQIQAFRVVWYSQLGKELVETEQPPNVAIEDVVQQLKAAQPCAVILGTPGSGKSTTMRWFAYLMANACRLSWYHHRLNVILHFLNRRIGTQFSGGYYLPKKLAPKQIPILIRIADYAKALNEVKNGQLPFETFFLDHIKAEYPYLPKLGNRLLQDLQNGNSLLLLDGLDEVASDELRRRVANQIDSFIASYTPEKPTSRHYNRFIITSRIVGYEAGTFANYAHYTLQDLQDEQIEKFLTSWCLAVERYQIASPQGGRKRLTVLQEDQARKDGAAQRDRLLEVFHNNASIKRLAINPLMLTILALLQRSGKTLPQRRINLYQVVTRTLIDNWNQNTGRKVFLEGEIRLAEDMLGKFAYELHKSDLLLTEEKVKEIAYQAMNDFYHAPPTDSTVEHFIEKLRSTTGLFVESGQGLFSFMHRTFQEYFVSLYLLNKPSDQLELFIQIHSHIPIWHEPLLLLIAFKSEQSSRSEQEKVAQFIRIILNTNTDYEIILHRGLLFAASIIADCNAWTIDYDLQQHVAYDLFELYGDSFRAERYTQLKENIERVALLWLRGQLPSSDIRPPLLEAWRSALCNSAHLARQKGAAQLLASIAVELASCPKLVLSTLIPPLLQLASLQDLPCPTNIRTQFLQPPAEPASIEIAEYAFVTLRLLDADGPAGWLHQEWRQWNHEHPRLLEHLTQHSLELDYLLTPAAFSNKSDGTHWQKRITISRYWQERGRAEPRHLQTELLSTHNAVCYPYAYIFKQLLELEIASSSTPWRDIWNTFLKQEMMRGRNATYQACLHLRLLLYQEDTQQRQNIAEELMDALSTPNHSCSALAIIAIANMFWIPVRTPRYLQEFREPWLRELHNLLDMRDVLDTQRLYLQYLQKLQERRNLRYLREQRYIVTLQRLLDLRNIRGMWELRNIRHLFKLLDLREMLNCEQLVLRLCNILEQQVDDMSSTILITLCSIMTTTHFIEPFRSQVWKSIQKFEQQARQAQHLNREHRLLIATIAQCLEITQSPHIAPTSPPLQGTPEELVNDLFTLKQRKRLTEQDTQKLLRASTDIRRLSVDKQLELYTSTSTYLDTVQAATWEILNQSFVLEGNALSIILRYLDSDDPILCVSAALLAQHSKKDLSNERRKQVADKIIAALNRDVSSHRPLQPSDSIKFWRQDDILFEVLNAMTI